MTGTRIAKGAAVAIGAFAILGSVTALWPTPFFVRMTPSGVPEVVGLALTAVLAGVYTAVRRPRCSVKTASVGGVLGFLGVACPTCNKVLMLAFGGPLLIAYFEPVRLYLMVGGILLLGWAIWGEIRTVRDERSGDPA